MARNVGPTVVFSLSLVSLLLALYLAPRQNFVNISWLRRQSENPTVYNFHRNITYIGTHQDGVEHFQNIFYAEETSGKNRFAPPVKLNPSRGAIIDATKTGAWCPQGTGDILPFTSSVTNISENCLSLRIARPRGVAAGAKLPVAVWLHGGGHALGSGQDVLYEPDGLVKQAATDDRPLVWVAISYRLGLFGFAASKALTEVKHTNVGLRDQRAALEWVRDNIAAFGGDPKNVTAIGQSVGASDIGLHLTSFDGKLGVPFQKAVMLSGAPGLNFNTQSDFVANNTADIAKQVGCIHDGDAQSSATLTCLKEAPADILTNLSVTAARAAHPPFGEAFFHPTYDSDLITDRPSKLMRAGKFAATIPVLASWVSNDGAWYAAPTTATDEEVVASFGLYMFGLSDATQSRLLELYPLKDFEHMVRPKIDGPISAQYYRAAQMNRDLWFVCPILDFAWQYAKHSGSDASEVWLREHNATRFTPVFEKMGVPMWRVAHLSDIPYVLNSQRLGGGADNSAEQLELSKHVSREIADFVNTGDTWVHTRDWEERPAAFNLTADESLEKDFPGHMFMDVFGGDDGTGPAKITSHSSLGHDVSDVQKAVDWEKLWQRCEFTNSEKVREEMSV